MVHVVARRADKRIQVAFGHGDDDSTHTHLRGAGDDSGCDCLAPHAGFVHVSVHVKLEGACERLVTYSHREGEEEDERANGYVSAPRATCERVAAALGVADDEVGYALRTVMLAADPHGHGEARWVCVERLAS